MYLSATAYWSEYYDANRVRGDLLRLLLVVLFTDQVSTDQKHNLGSLQFSIHQDLLEPVPSLTASDHPHFLARGRAEAHLVPYQWQ